MADNQDAFSRILNRMEAAESGITEKTAEAGPATASPAERMLATVRGISSAVKVASAPVASATPADSLERMAKEAQAAEQDQLLKQAQFMGAAVADGFMERFAQYDAALSAQGVKTAAHPQNEEYLEKVAAAAYGQAVQDMEKQAAAEFEQGYNDQLQAIHKLAADIHYIGQQSASHLIQQARSSV
jgi:hypothetical protein